MVTISLETVETEILAFVETELLAVHHGYHCF